jgi:hypothetical protein
MPFDAWRFEAGMTRETKQQFIHIDARQGARNIGITEVTMVVEEVVVVMILEEEVVVVTMSQRRWRRQCWRCSRPEFHHLDVNGPTVVLCSGQSDGVQNPVLLVTEHACNKTSHVTRHTSQHQHVDMTPTGTQHTGANHEQQEATGTTARLSPPPKYVKNTETLLFRCKRRHTQCRIVEVLIEGF